jgi:hypothetical protein
MLKMSLKQSKKIICQWERHSYFFNVINKNLVEYLTPTATALVAGTHEVGATVDLTIWRGAKVGFGYEETTRRIKGRVVASTTILARGCSFVWAEITVE